MFSLLFRSSLIFALALWPFEKSGESPKILPTQLDLPENVEEVEMIRVLLINSTPEVTIEAASPYRVLDRDQHLIFKGNKIVATLVKANAEGIQIGNQNFKRAPITIQSDGEGIKIGKKVYRNALKIWRNSSKSVSVINEIKVEDYLRGVLPWEANPSWSPEALKAQAVASRTYALFRAIENQKEKFTLRQDVLSQVYGGKTLEHAKTDQAIAATKGEVLTYKGKIFPAYFHSTCGGQTTRADYLWNVEKHPALKGVVCEFCQTSKHYRWKMEINRSDLESVLQKHGFKISGIRSVIPVDLDASGRARNFLIEWSKAKTKIHSNDFRLWFDPSLFKSTLIESVTKKPDSFVFKGRGWGHGVGMCQYGMKQLAELGYSYREILEHYYPGAELTNVNERPSQ